MAGQMSYSLSFTQSVFIVLYVANKGDQSAAAFVSTQQISRDLEIPPSTAGMILRRLNRAGLMDTREGVNGGVRLSMPPDEVSLLDIFTAIEQERPLFQTNMQVTTEGEKMSRSQQTVASALDGVEMAMKRKLQMTSIRDLMKTINR
jgi:Rrf2 family protein